MYRYLKKFLSAAIEVRTDTPDLGGLQSQEFNWCHIVYEHVKEMLQKYLPQPLGKSASTISDKIPIYIMI
jgi:hypothetical protein